MTSEDAPKTRARGLAAAIASTTFGLSALLGLIDAVQPLPPGLVYVRAALGVIFLPAFAIAAAQWVADRRGRADGRQQGTD